MYHEKNIGEECIFHVNVSVFKQKTIIFATRPEYLYHTKRRKTGDRRADAHHRP